MKKKELRDFQWLKKRDKIPGLEKAFWEMWEYYDLYLRKAEDLPYSSTEMALVGNLAMAAARRGYPAALEFYREGSRKKPLQRADLWVRFSSKQELLVEAKTDYISVGSGEKTIVGDIRYYFREADRYLERFVKGLKITSTKPVRCSSIFFAQICIAERDYKKPYRKILRELLRACRNAGKEAASFYAYYFLEDNPNLRKILEKYRDPDNYYYPGIVIFGKILKLK